MHNPIYSSFIIRRQTSPVNNEDLAEGRKDSKEGKSFSATGANANQTAKKSQKPTTLCFQQISSDWAESVGISPAPVTSARPPGRPIVSTNDAARRTSIGDDTRHKPKAGNHSARLSRAIIIYSLTD